jgi:hypothetical protein
LGKGSRPGHRFSRIDEVDEDVEIREVVVETGDFTDGDTLVDGGYVKEVEISDDDDSVQNDEVDGEVCGIKRKRTIRVIIRSRAFL